MDRATVESLTGPQLVELFNKTTGKNVKRFATREDGIKRTLAALGQPALTAAPEPESNAAPPNPAPAVPDVAPAVEAPADKAGGKPARKPKKKAGAKAKAVKGDGPRPGSKRFELMEALRGPGVTMEAACKRWSWLPRDFRDAIRLLKSNNGIAAVEEEDGKWRAK